MSEQDWKVKVTAVCVGGCLGVMYLRSRRVRSLRRRWSVIRAAVKGNPIMHRIEVDGSRGIRPIGDRGAVFVDNIVRGFDVGISVHEPT